jgi:hypothetical protein
MPLQHMQKNRGMLMGRLLGGLLTDNSSSNTLLVYLLAAICCHLQQRTSEMNKTVTPDGIKVEVGQRWRDLDRRMNGRVVTITRVDELNGYAYYKSSREARLSIWRMRPVGGWELVP